MGPCGRWRAASHDATATLYTSPEGAPERAYGACLLKLESPNRTCIATRGSKRPANEVSYDDEPCRFRIEGVKSGGCEAC